MKEDIRLTDQDMFNIEIALDQLESRQASDRYPGTTTLWEMAKKHKVSVASLLRVYLQAPAPAEVHQKKATPGTLDSLSDENLCERATALYKNSDAHPVFKDNQIAFIAELKYKLDNYGPYTVQQRRFAIDMIKKGEEYLEIIADKKQKQNG